MYSKNIIKILILLLFANVGIAGENIMPVNQIKPGMRGFGKTIFSGMEIEEFQFEVIEIIKNFRAKRDLILVKLVGEKVEKTGVVAGMSGSPVYIDGKLIGALAYSMGIFMKDPIAGITPIEQMLEIFDNENVREEELALNRGFNAQYLEMAIGVRELKMGNFIPPQFQKIKNQKTGSAGIFPLAIPLLFSGFENSVIESYSEIFSGLGFKVLNVGGTFSTEPEEGLSVLEPGDAFSVVIVDGDLGLQATGTVTYCDGEKILGMGHPFLNSGAVGLPLGKAKILTTLSSLMASTKMASLTEIIGTVHQDRSTGIMGVRGEEPEMIPFRINVRSRVRPNTEFNFRIAEDRSIYSITPFIFQIVLTNALESARLSVPNQTLQLEGAIQLKGQKSIILQNYFAGGVPSSFLTDAAQAVGEISSILGALLSNNFELPEIESVELNFTAHPKKYLASIQGIEVDKSVVKPGEKINILVDIKEYQGERHRIQQTLKIPDDIDSNRILLFAGSGSRLTQIEYRTSPQEFRPKTFNQLVDLLESRRKNNYLFFQIRERNNGVIVEGEKFPSLPPSILSVMNSQKSSGNVQSLRYRVLSEEKAEVEYSISGGRTIWLKVEPKDE